MKHSNLLEKTSIQRQYQFEVDAGNSVFVIDNPFENFSLVPNGDNLPLGEIEFFPAVSAVFEKDPGINGRVFLSKAGDATTKVGWRTEATLQVNFVDINAACFCDLTLSTPLKGADKLSYTRT